MYFLFFIIFGTFGIMWYLETS